MSATCIVRENLRVQGVTVDQRRALVMAGRVRSPEYAKALRAGALPWRLPPEWIDFARCDGEDLILSRGLAALVRREVPGVRFDDQRQRVPFRSELSRVLRPEQAACVAAATGAEQGLIPGPCGSGKSTVIQGAIAACGQRAAVVVPTLDIAEQFVRDVRDHLGVKAGMFGCGRDDLGDVTIVTYASLLDLERRARLFGHIGSIFFDEVHNATGPKVRAIVDECAAAIRIGVTATLPTDERSGIIHALFGRVLHRLETPKLVRLGRLTRPEYRQISTAFEAEGNDFAAIVDATTQDADRNALVVRTVVQHAGPGCLGLALLGRVEHAERIASELRARGLRAEALTGQGRTKDRERILTAARAGELDVLCATSLADEGLDIPNIARVFLVAPQKAGGRFVQRIGRSMRPHPGKPTPLVLDFADVRCGLLAHQARGRARAFEAIWREEAFAA